MTTVSFTSLPAVSSLGTSDQTLIIQSGVSKRATVNDVLNAINTTGFASPLLVGTATLAGHAVTKAQLDAAGGGGIADAANDSSYYLRHALGWVAASTVGRTGVYTDLTSKPTLGGAASLNVGTTTGTVAAGDDSRVTGAAQKASNLSDLASASTARTNLGLGTASTLASSAVAQTANNLSDLASATTARTNLGLVIGTDVQAYSAKTAARAALTWVADTIDYFTSTSATATTALTSFGRSLIGATNLSALQAILGTGTPSSTTYLRGDGTWSTPATGGNVTSLTSFGCVCDGVTDDAAAIAALSPGYYTVPSNTFVTQLYVPTGVTLAMTGGRLILDTAQASPPAPQVFGSIVWPNLPQRQIGGACGSLGGSIPARGISGNNVKGTNFNLWITALSNGAVRWDPALNVGISNADVTTYTSQIDNLVTAGMPPWCFFALLVNPVSAPGTPYTTWQLAPYCINAIFRLLSLGCRPIIFITPPRDASQWADAATRQTALSTMELFRDLAPKLGDILVADPRKSMIDATSATGQALTNMLEDGVHPSDLGAVKGAGDIATDLKARLLGSSAQWLAPDVPVNASDRYTAATAAGGNLCSTALMTGTNGTLNAVANAGIPATVTIVTSNVTVTPTIVARTDGFPGNKLRLSYSAATPSTGTITVTLPNDVPSAGSKCRASCGFAVAYGGIAVAQVDEVALAVVYTPTATGGNPIVGQQAINQSGDWSGRLYTGDHLVPASVSAASLQVQIKVGTGAGSRVIDITSPALRIIPVASPPLLANVAQTWLASSLALPTGDVFARASSAYQLDYSTPGIASKASNLPRFAKLAGGQIVVMSEGSRANEVTDLNVTTGNWSNGNTTVAGLAGPFGGTGAYRVTGSSQVGDGAATNPGARSLYVRSVTGDGARTSAVCRRFNDSAGPVGFTETWGRVTVAAASLNDTVGTFYAIDLRAAGLSTGTATRAELFWPQSEANADFPSTLIDAAATRAAETWTSAASRIYQPAAGYTWVIEGVTAAGAGTTEGDQVAVQSDDGSNNNALRFARRGSDKHAIVQVRSGGSAVVTLDLGVLADNAYFKVAVRLQDGSWAASLNGAAVVTSATSIGTLLRASAMRRGSGVAANWWFGGLARHDQVAPMTNGQLVTAST